jgi:hypothetical protein
MKFCKKSLVGVGPSQGESGHTQWSINLNCLLAREILPQMFKIVDPILEISTHSEQRIDTECRLLFPLYFVLCLLRLPAN